MTTTVTLRHNKVDLALHRLRGPRAGGPGVGAGRAGKGACGLMLCRRSSPIRRPPTALPGNRSEGYRLVTLRDLVVFPPHEA